MASSAVVSASNAAAPVAPPSAAMRAVMNKEIIRKAFIRFVHSFIHHSFTDVAAGGDYYYFSISSVRIEQPPPPGPPGGGSDDGLRRFLCHFGEKEIRAMLTWTSARRRQRWWASSTNLAGMGLDGHEHRIGEHIATC